MKEGRRREELTRGRYNSLEITAWLINFKCFDCKNKLISSAVKLIQELIDHFSRLFLKHNLFLFRE